jgi:hypothetical protein
MDDFYFAQHEIGYLQAGALVEHMAATWGWEAFHAFYRDIHPIENGSQSQAVEAALQEHFGLSLEGLEDSFLAALRSQPVTAASVHDVRLTVEYYDLVRRYQQELDPAAYFLTAWMPCSPGGEEACPPADYLRHPQAPQNVAVETLLVGADQALRGGDYASTQRLLEMARAALDALAGSPQGPF